MTHVAGGADRGGTRFICLYHMRCVWVWVLVGCGHPLAKNPYVQWPVDLDAVRKTCAMEVSCFADPPLNFGGQCVTMFEFSLAVGGPVFWSDVSSSAVERYVTCGAGASSCDELLQCASQGHGPEWCNARGDRACDGDVLID